MDEDGACRYFVNTGTSTAPKFDEQFGSANPFDAIEFNGVSSPVFADLDGDGTLKPCPSISSDRDPTFCLSQATWTSFQATSTTSTTSEQLQCRSLRQQQAPPTPSTVLTSRIEVPSRSLILRLSPPPAQTFRKSRPRGRGESQGHGHGCRERGCRRDR